jgi:hypothetical protein
MWASRGTPFALVPKGRERRFTAIKNSSVFGAILMKA